jgi:hypothetical protein
VIHTGLLSPFEKCNSVLSPLESCTVNVPLSKGELSSTFFPLSSPLFPIQYPVWFVLWHCWFVPPKWKQ